MIGTLITSQISKLITYAYHFVTNRVLNFLLRLWWGKPRRCSRPDNIEQAEIVMKSAVELAAAIREQKLTSYEVVRAYYDRIKKLKLELNAIVDGPFEEALEEAKIIDHRIKNQRVTEAEFAEKPFLGVPFTTKDSTAVRGKLHTLGLTIRENTVADEDAEIVMLVKLAGGIVIATSNIPGMNLWIETRNMLFGQTNNPYDLRRSAGGSSGGEAALISSCCTGFGLGSDIGGSIRIPSFNCGIFGHKPTMNVVCLRGCSLRTCEKFDTLVVAGPMARYATDLLQIFKVIVGPKMAIELRLDEKVDVKKLRYFYMPSNCMARCNPITPGAKLVMEKVKEHFKELTGVEVQEVELPYINQTHKMWFYWMSQEPKNINDLINRDAPYFHLALAFNDFFGSTIKYFYDWICSTFPKTKRRIGEKEIRETTERCRLALKATLGDDGVLFFHSSPRTAPMHYYPVFKYWDFTYFSIFNVLRVPATQVPMGLDSKYLPRGIQVVSTENNDRLCLAVAEELEREFGGWIPPFKKKK